MRRVLTCVVLASSLGFACLAACVGDDPATSTSSGSTSSGGSSSGGSSSGGSSSGGSSSGGSSSGGSSSGSTSGDGGDGSAPYDVRSLKGLKLWLESTKDLTPGSSGGAPLGTWADQSGAWDAATDGAPAGGRHVAEPHDVNPPSIVANGINGRPTVSFVDGNGYAHILNHEDWHFGLGDFVIVEVAKVSSGSGPLWLLRPGATAGSEEAFFPGQLCVQYGLGVDSGCTGPVYAPSTQPHVFVARRKGDMFTVRVDGTVRSSLDRSASPPDINIRDYQQQYVFVGNGVTMQLSEVIVVVGPTSDTDLGTLENHLKSKYAIP